MPKKTAEYWISRFGIFDGEDHHERAEEELLRLGKRAVPALIAGLRHRNGYGWMCASILGELGQPTATPALVHLVAAVKRPTRTTTDLWSARALGMMGQTATLMNLASKKRLLHAVVVGLSRARPQSYALFETLLARKDKRLTKQIADELAPGSAHYDPPAGTFDLVAAAVGSNHVSLRKDAMLAITEFRGKKAKTQAVAVLVPLLTDRDAEVRRLAVLGLSRCKTAARPAIPAIRPLLRDKAKLVRQFAQIALNDLGDT